MDDRSKIEQLVKESGSSFYWGMKLLSKPKRRAMFSLYAFCRVVDDIADDEKILKKKKQLELNLWKKKIDNIFKKKNVKGPLLRELKNSINEFSLSKENFYSIIDGMLMDVKTDIQFPSTKVFKLYCERVAVAVGYLSIKIFGIKQSIGNKYAYSLGMAFQITNIVRDFYEDLKNKRCYLPSSKLKKYGIKKNLKDIENNPYIQNILQEMLEEAKNEFERADLLKKGIDKKKIIGSEIMKLFYKSIHQKMFKKKINLKNKIKLNIWDKFLIFLNFTFR